MGESDDRNLFDDPTPLEPVASPLLPGPMASLFLRPRQFFSGHLALGSTPYVVFVTYACGLAFSADRIDSRLMRTDLGGSAPLIVNVAESWPLYWATVLGFGLISALLLWSIGGWWYRVRIKWSGHADPDAKQARLVFIYATFVWALPAILASVIASLIYPSYLAYWNADQAWSAVLMIFPFWSCVVSYLGVTAVFQMSKWKARIWFLILPLLLYGGGFLMVVLAYFFLDQ